MKKISFILAVLLIMTSVLASCKKNASNESTKPAETDVEAVFESKTELYKDNGNPIAVIVMDDGEAIVMELLKDTAPNTVNNFIYLANKGFYDGTIFHRVIENFMIQGGDPDGVGTGGPGYNIFGEFSDNGFKNTVSHERGYVSMARQGSDINPEKYYNTAGSQFFICVTDSSFLDGQYAVFGHVLEGMEEADKIVASETNSKNKPIKDCVMKYVRVETYGKTYEEPSTLA